MLSFLGTNTIPVYVHQTATNPPVSIEAISMFPDLLVEATVLQVNFITIISFTYSLHIYIYI